MIDSTEDINVDQPIFATEEHLIGDYSLIEILDYISTQDFSVKEIGDLIWGLSKQDYKEKPVSFEKFSRDKAFLGNTLEKGHFPMWRKLSEDLYPHPLFSPYYEVIAETPIGSGKSVWASSSILYEGYKMNLLHNPQKHYGLIKNTKISFVIMSYDLNAVGDINWGIIEGFISESKYLSEIISLPRGKGTPDELDFQNSVSIKFASRPYHLTGRAVFGGMCDEANVNRYIKTIYGDIIRRMNSRFPIGKFGGIFPGKLFLLSSPKAEGSFMAERVNDQKTFTLCLTNIPIWKIRDPGPEDLNLSGENFQFFVGNKTKDPCIITKKTNITPDMVPHIIDIPMEYYQFFKDDPIESMREILGVRTAGKDKLFRSDEFVKACFPDYSLNPCTEEILELDFDDAEDKIINYFPDLSVFTDPVNPNSARFIHIDVGISGDKLGIACAHSIEKKVIYHDDILEEDSIKLVRKIYVDFMFALKKPTNEEVCIPKLIDFLLYLKNELNYPLALVTTDSFEGRVLKQFLRLNSVQTGRLSIDKDYEVWKFGRSMIIFCQVVGPAHNLLFREIMDLEDNGKTYDHPKVGQDGRPGSHDLTQAVFGAIYNAGTADSIVSNMSFSEFFQEQENVNDLSYILKKQYNRSGNVSFGSYLNNNFLF